MRLGQTDTFDHIKCSLHHASDCQRLAKSHAWAAMCRFQVVNAILIPGGGQNLSPHHPFYDAVAVLVDLAKQANDAGDYFPVNSHDGFRCRRYELQGELSFQDR